MFKDRIKITHLPLYIIPLLALLVFTIVPVPETESVDEFNVEVLGVQKYEVSAIPDNKQINTTGSINPLRRILECNRLANNPCKESLKRLTILINDKNSVVKAHAVSALENYTGEQSITLLIRFLEKGDWRSRRCAAQALAKSSNPRALVALTKALDDESAMVRNTARKALT